MHRFYLPPEQCAGSELELSGREARHAAQVLRVRRGETAQVLDGAGQVLSGVIREAGRDRVRLQVLERRTVAPPPYELTLLQAIPRGKIIESIIQKSTELGAHRIVPLLTERVVPHLHDHDAAGKAERWRWVAIEAIKQCGSAWLPRVEEPAPLQQWLGREKSELALFGALREHAVHPRLQFMAFQARHQRRPKSVSVWIGPEGDFSPSEVVLLESGGVLPITLGTLVLRTETAAVYCLSVLNYELRAPEPAAI